MSTLRALLKQPLHDAPPSVAQRAALVMEPVAKTPITATSKNGAKKPKPNAVAAQERLRPEPDVHALARFLHYSHALEILLFYKDADRYSALFSEAERVPLASQICSTYLDAGARLRVSISSSHVTAIQRELDASCELVPPSEDLFDEAQAEAYELLRLDLYPRFLELYASLHGCVRANENTVAASLAEVLSGANPATCASFEAFVRETFCEEALLFWLEAHSFALLFSSRDLCECAAAMCTVYVKEGAEHEINISDEARRGILQRVAANEVDSSLFVPAQKELADYLEHDVFPRYLEWAHARIKQVAVGSGGGFGGGGGDGAHRRSTALMGSTVIDTNAELARSEMRRFMTGPHLATVRQVATELNALEHVDLWADIQAFKLLFAPADRRKAARRIVSTYLADGARRKAALPHGILTELRDELEASADDVNPAAFDRLEAEVFVLISDNMYGESARRIASCAESPGPSDGSAAEGGCGATGGACSLM